MTSSRNLRQASRASATARRSASAVRRRVSRQVHAVTACGNAQGMDFPGTVAPFILRGVTLYGIDSNTATMPLRLDAWARLARDLDPAKLAAITKEIPLAGAIPAASEILAGKVRGRLVVNVAR